MDEVVNKNATLIRSCYRFETNYMTGCSINILESKNLQKPENLLHFSGPY